MSSIKLYSFQRTCVDKLGNPELASRLIGDDLGMGLGKTIELGVIDVRLRSKTPRKPSEVRKTLIIAPLSVHDHWYKHLKMVWPNACIYVMDRTGTPLQGRRAFAKAVQMPYWNYYIIHYEATRAKDLLPVLKKVLWFHVVADECHRLKNKKAQQTRAVKSFKTKYKSGLSGTPADDKPQDLWSILNWLWPQNYRSFWRYVGDFCLQETTCQECGGVSVYEGGPVLHTSRCTKTGTTFKKIVGVNKDNIPVLHKEMARYYVRRLKTDPGILDELPPKTYTDITVDLSPRQRKMYDTMRKEMIAWVGEHEDQPLTASVVVAQLTRLQQFALASAHLEFRKVKRRNSPEEFAKTGEKFREEMRRVVVLEEPSTKLDALEEIINDHPNESFVVFTQFRSMANLVVQRLESKKIRTGLYTGNITSQQVRDRTVELFQRGDIQVFVGTIAAGGESITLHRASTVVFLDRSWTPNRNIQAEDRLHRVGQKHPVQVIDIVARNTIDLGRRTKIAKKWEELRILLGDIR
jgi:SNF2 family DNA or RNA helicase